MLCIWLMTSGLKFSISFDNNYRIYLFYVLVTPVIIASYIFTFYFTAFISFSKLSTNSCSTLFIEFLISNLEFSNSLDNLIYNLIISEACSNYCTLHAVNFVWNLIHFGSQSLLVVLKLYIVFLTPKIY